MEGDMFELDRKDQYSERILSADVTSDAGYFLTVHDKFMML
jgi:hypothetical protein